MPKGPKGQKRPADVIGNAVRVMRIATGEVLEVRLTERKAAQQKIAAGTSAALTRRCVHHSLRPAPVAPFGPVAELVDAPDLKSVVPKGTCLFDSDRGHHPASRAARASQDRSFALSKSSEAR